MDRAQKTIAIVGAGITGLVAARECIKKGHRVVIFEKYAEPGGLAAGFQTHGTYLEKAYHHIFRTDKDILSLMEELGLTENIMWNFGSTGMLYEGKIHPFATPVDLIRLPALSFWNRFRTGLMLFWLQQSKKGDRFVSVSAKEWLLKYGGKEAYKVLWEPLLVGKFHQYADKVSMAWLWSRLRTRANSRAPGSFSPELGYIRGGFHVLIDRLMEDLRSKGAEFHFNASLSSVSSTNGKVTLALADGNVTVDQAIFTVPSAVFATLAKSTPEMSEMYRQQLTSIDYLGATCLVFSTSQSLSPVYWLNIHDLSSPFLVCIQHTRLTGTKMYGGEHLYYLGTYTPHDHPTFTGDEALVTAKFFEGFRKIFPAFDETQITEKHLFHLAHAQHVADVGYPRKIPGMQTPLQGVYLSNFSQIFPEDRGTNFAVRDGKRVAALAMGAAA